jgi:hypothetical protein
MENLPIGRFSPLDLAVKKFAMQFRCQSNKAAITELVASHIFWSSTPPTTSTKSTFLQDMSTKMLQKLKFLSGLKNFMD